jgi:hypothetical protein
MAIVYRLTKGEHFHDKNGREVPAFTSELWHGVDVCSFCGQPYAAAWWLGHQPISVCRKCAIENLPRLLADAVAGENADGPNVASNLHRAWEQAETRFWMAASCAISRAAERSKKCRENQPDD